MTLGLPVVETASLTAWCKMHLGSPAESELFRTGHLTRVIGTRLADGREVVVRVRRYLRLLAYPLDQVPLVQHDYASGATAAGPRP